MKKMTTDGLQPLRFEPVDVLKPTEAATLLRVDVKTVKAWLTAGLIDGFKLPGGHWRVTDRSLIDRWNEAHEGGDA